MESNEQTKDRSGTDANPLGGYVSKECNLARGMRDVGIDDESLR